MYRVFSMGIGMVLVVRRRKAEILERLEQMGKAYLIGQIEKQDRSSPPSSSPPA